MDLDKIINDINEHNNKIETLKRKRDNIINIYDEKGNTPLHEACRLGHIKHILFLKKTLMKFI